MKTIAREWHTYSIYSPTKSLYTGKTIVMTKEIEITLKQQDELLNVSMTSFREASLGQSIRDANRWWVKNFLPDAVIQRVDRISVLTYKITYYNE